MSEELVAQLKTDNRFGGLGSQELKRIADLAVRMRSLSLFEPLSDLERAYIAQAGKLQEGERGDILIHQGSTDKTLYFILKGQLRVWKKDEQGRTLLLNYVGEDDFCGELVFIEGEEERALWQAYQQANHALSASPSLSKFVDAFAPVVPQIDLFFDKVMVMAEDEALRNNRLGLMKALADLTDGIVDLTQIQGS